MVQKLFGTESTSRSKEERKARVAAATDLYSQGGTTDQLFWLKPTMQIGGAAVGAYLGGVEGASAGWDLGGKVGGGLHDLGLHGEGSAAAADKFASAGQSAAALYGSGKDKKGPRGTGIDATPAESYLGASDRLSGAQLDPDWLASSGGEGLAAAHPLARMDLDIEPGSALYGIWAGKR